MIFTFYLIANINQEYNINTNNTTSDHEIHNIMVLE